MFSFCVKQSLTALQKYQNAASFVPKMVGKVIGWLDVQPDDVILDLGCGGTYFIVSFSHL